MERLGGGATYGLGNLKVGTWVCNGLSHTCIFLSLRCAQRQCSESSLRNMCAGGEGCAQEKTKIFRALKVSPVLTVQLCWDAGSTKLIPNSKGRAAARSRFDVKLSDRGLNFSSWTWLQGSLFSHTASSTCSNISLGIVAEAVLSVFPMWFISLALNSSLFLVWLCWNLWNYPSVSLDAIHKQPALCSTSISWWRRELWRVERCESNWLYLLSDLEKCRGFLCVCCNIPATQCPGWEPRTECISATLSCTWQTKFKKKKAFLM